MSRRAQLLRATRQAVRRQADLRAQIGSQVERPPAPGDVFGVAQTAGTGVEWVILASDPEDSRRLLAAPADGGTLLGSGDLAMSESAPSGPLTVRCRFGAWLDAELFDPRSRTAVLSLADLARARDRWHQISDGVFSGSVLGREVDDDPEYRDWLDEVVAPAHRALAGSEATPSPTRASETPSRFGRRTLIRIAASLLVVAATALAGSWLWRQQSLDDLAFAGAVAERQRRQEVTRLVAERDRLRAELEQAGDELAAVETPYRERLAALERDLEVARLRASSLNPYLAPLSLPGVQDAEITSLRIPSDASHLVLVMPLAGGSSSGGYRAELLPDEGEAAVWTSQRLTPNESGEVAVGIPAEKVPPGKYRVRLSPDDSSPPVDYQPRRGSTAGSRLELLAPFDYAVQIENP